MVGKLRDHFDIGDRLIENDAVDGFDVVSHDFEKWPQAVASIANIFKRYNATQVGPQINYVP
jgi:hypothetical protein